MFLILVEQEQYNQNNKLLEVVNKKKDTTHRVYSNKLLTESSNVFRSSIKSSAKLEKPKKLTEYSESKVVNRKVSDSSSSSSSQVKRGPGRPKKVLKPDDGHKNNTSDRCDVKEKRLKLDCGSIVAKHKISNSSSSDLSPPVLEPWSPFSPRKDSTHTPPTLSPISSVAKLSDVQKSSDDDEKFYKKKKAKKRLTSLTLV